MGGCKSDKDMLRKTFDSGDQSILALYREFSRFMLEHLEIHPFTKKCPRGSARGFQ
jgi:pyoverdine/dityrosine biosynthesis protein Dit1